MTDSTNRGGGGESPTAGFGDERGSAAGGPLSPPGVTRVSSKQDKQVGCAAAALHTHFLLQIVVPADAAAIAGIVMQAIVGQLRGALENTGSITLSALAWAFAITLAFPRPFYYRPCPRPL